MIHYVMFQINFLLRKRPILLQMFTSKWHNPQHRANLERASAVAKKGINDFQTFQQFYSFKNSATFCRYETLAFKW